MFIVFAIISDNYTEVLYLYRKNMNDFICYFKEPEILLPFIAILISVCTLIFSVLYNRSTLAITNKHNKLSVKPLVDFMSYNSRNIEKLVIKNKGLGPAIISSIIFYDENEASNVLLKIVLKHMPIAAFEIDQDESRTINIMGKLILGSNEEFSLHEIVYKNDIPRSLVDIHDKIVMEIKYQSIYNEDFTLKTKIYEDFKPVSKKQI